MCPCLHAVSSVLQSFIKVVSHAIYNAKIMVCCVFPRTYPVREKRNSNCSDRSGLLFSIWGFFAKMYFVTMEVVVVQYIRWDRLLFVNNLC